AALADLHAHRQRRAADAGCGDLGLGALALPLLFTARDVVLPCAIRPASGWHRDALGDQEVRREAVGDALHVPALAELRDVLGQDDLHAREPSLSIHARSRGPSPLCCTASPTVETAPGMRRMTLRTGPGVSR